MASYTYLTLAADLTDNGGRRNFGRLVNSANNTDQTIVNTNGSSYLYSAGKFTRFVVGRFLEPSNGGIFVWADEPTFAITINNEQQIAGFYVYSSGDFHGHSDPFNGSTRGFVISTDVYTTLDFTQVVNECWC